MNFSLGILPLAAGFLFVGITSLARQVQGVSRETGVHRGKKLFLQREGGSCLMSIDARGNARMSIKGPAGRRFDIKLGSESLCCLTGIKEEGQTGISLTDQQQSHLFAAIAARRAVMGYFEKKSGFVVQSDPRTAIVIAGSSELGGGRLSIHFDGTSRRVDCWARSSVGGFLSTSTIQGAPVVEVGSMKDGGVGWRMYGPDRSEIFRWGLSKSVHQLELQDPKFHARASLRLENTRAPVWTAGRKR